MGRLVESRGYEHVGDLYNGETVADKYSVKNITKYKGVDGFFYASVMSPKYYKDGVGHAVVCDKDLNIVHDPNPNNKGIKTYPNADKIGHNGIRQIWLFEKKKHNKR
jgi:hypothetical protein